MRWHILRTLIGKEVHRLAADRGIILLGIVLVCMALLLSIFGKRTTESGLAFAVGDTKCYIDYWHDSPWIDHLRQRIPEEWQREKKLEIRHVSQAMVVRGMMVYPQGHVGIQIRPLPPGENGPRYLLWFWYPAQDPAALAPFEAWFWKESSAYTDTQLMAALD